MTALEDAEAFLNGHLGSEGNSLSKSKPSDDFAVDIFSSSDLESDEFGSAPLRKSKRNRDLGSIPGSYTILGPVDLQLGAEMQIFEDGSGTFADGYGKLSEVKRTSSGFHANFSRTDFESDNEDEASGRFRFKEKGSHWTGNFRSNAGSTSAEFQLKRKGKKRKCSRSLEEVSEGEILFSEIKKLKPNTCESSYLDCDEGWDIAGLKDDIALVKKSLDNKIDDLMTESEDEDEDKLSLPPPPRNPPNHQKPAIIKPNKKRRKLNFEVDGPMFKEGQEVWCLWHDQHDETKEPNPFRATIDKVHAKSKKYDVIWQDGDMTDRKFHPESDIRKLGDVNTKWFNLQYDMRSGKWDLCRSVTKSGSDGLPINFNYTKDTPVEKFESLSGVSSRGSSKYVGVYWRKSNKWEARVRHANRMISCGTYSDEVEAAHAVNARCDQLEISRKNLEIGDPPAGFTIRVRKRLVQAKQESDSESTHIEEHSNSSGGSGYTGVSANGNNWKASIGYQGKHRYCGTYSTALDAAHAVNLKCDQLGISRKNPKIGDPPEGFTLSVRKYGKAKQKSNPEDSGSTYTEESLIGVSSRGRSKYVGVSWRKKQNKWQAKILHKDTWHHAGTYSDEIEAAHAVNLKCDQLQIPRKNLAIGDPPEGFTLSVRKYVKAKQKSDPEDSGSTYTEEDSSFIKQSEYKGVCWDKQSKKWKATVAYQAKRLHCGYYVSEMEAALATNFKCDELGIKRKNPTAGDPPEDFHPTFQKKPSAPQKKPNSEILYPNKSSKYIGVRWNKKQKKWTAQTTFNGRSFYCGSYRDELEAAHAINMKSDELGLPRKNIGIGDPPAEFKPSNEVSHQKWPARSEPKIKPSLSARRRSKYVGVSWIKRTKRWKAVVSDGGEHFYCGTYSDDIEAAHAVNIKCDQLDIPRKNLGIGDPPEGFTLSVQNRFVQAKRESNPEDSASTTDSEENDRGPQIGDALDGFMRSSQKPVVVVKQEEGVEDSLAKESESDSDSILYESKYVGVSWDFDKEMWEATLECDGKQVCCGYYSEDIDAARAINDKCDELLISQKNDIGDNVLGFKHGVFRLTKRAIQMKQESDSESSSDSETGEAEKQRTSRYIGVRFDESSGMWRAERTLRGEPYRSNKRFVNEKDAAMESDAIIKNNLDSLAVGKKIPKLNFPDKSIERVLRDMALVAQRKWNGEKSSRFECVSWVKKTKKWRATFTVSGEKYNPGDFENEIEAARAINAKCDELDIPHKNKISEPPRVQHSESADRVSQTGKKKEKDDEGCPSEHGRGKKRRREATTAVESRKKKAYVMTKAKKEDKDVEDHVPRKVRSAKRWTDGTVPVQSQRGKVPLMTESRSLEEVSEGEMLFSEMKELKPNTSKSSYLDLDGAWDVAGLKDDIAFVKKSRDKRIDDLMTGSEDEDVNAKKEDKSAEDLKRQRRDGTGSVDSRGGKAPLMTEGDYLLTDEEFERKMQAQRKDLYDELVQQETEKYKQQMIKKKKERMEKMKKMQEEVLEQARAEAKRRAMQQVKELWG